MDSKFGGQLTIQITREAESRLDDGTRRSHIITKPEAILAVGNAKFGQESGLLATECKTEDGGIFIGLIPTASIEEAGLRLESSDESIDRFSRQI